MAADTRTISSRTLELTGGSTRVERLLWIAVVISLIVDVVTTVVGLHLGLTESNPVARQAIDGFGIVGLVLLKGLAVGIGFACRPLLPIAYRPIIPAGLAIPWIVAGIANGITIWLVL